MPAGARLLLFFAFAALAGAQGSSEAEEGGGDQESVLETSGESSSDGFFDLEEDDPPPPAAPEDDPNRPPPVVVGAWTPPDLDPATAAKRAELERRCHAAPGDAAARLALAEFDAEHAWYQTAEEGFLRAAELDPESIRPWEGLLRLYRGGGGHDGGGVEIVMLPNGGVQVVTFSQSGTAEWLQAHGERERRIARAYEELVRRRPDDVARRREFVRHLARMRDFARAAAEARAILERAPADADSRYELAEALRKTGDAAGAERVLEENLRGAPGHAPSLLRLARLVALREGRRASDRILELERRALFHLFIPKHIANVPYREDTVDLAASLCGPSIAAALWDGAMRPTWPDEGTYARRWIVLAFPRSLHSERMDAVERLARRADEAAVGALLGLLWHMEDPEEVSDDASAAQVRELEDAAIRAAAGHGTAYFAAAERFLRAAESPAHRARAVRLLRSLRDARAVEPLVEALAWETDKDRSLGVAAALEELGDPRAVAALVEAALDARRPAPRRAEAAEALASFSDPRSIEALRRLEREDGFELVVAYGLFRLSGEPKAIRALELQLAGGAESERALALVARCDRPEVERLLLHAVVASPDRLRDAAVRLLEARYAESARPRLQEIFLAEARRPDPPASALRFLGKLGGEEPAALLLGLVERASGETWAEAARALAETGDPRGERYFQRARIVEKDPARRALAEELAPIASRRRAERQRAASGG
jgi:HEAT repeat protein